MRVFIALTVVGLGLLCACSGSSSTATLPLVPTQFASWQPHTSYHPGSQVTFPKSNGYVAVAETAGVSGDQEPVLPLAGKVQDNTVVWQFVSTGH